METENNHTEYSRREKEQYCQEMLEKAKSTVLAFVMDQDGTIKGGDDPEYKKENPAELLQKIARKGKYPSVITASGITALKSLSSLEAFYLKENIETPIFIGIGNGTALYRFDKKGRKEIYNNELTLEEAKAIVETWKNVYAFLNIDEQDLQPKGLETFRKFMDTDWQGLIPNEYSDIFKQYDGKCFTEKIKTTVVFPKWDEEKQRELVRKMQEELDKNLGHNKYAAVRGDDIFMHITRAFNVDSKLFAFKKIREELKLKNDNIAAFGDMPFDNDKGLLIDSGLPFSFTNKDIKKEDLKEPPFVLPGSSESEVGSVYKAIDYLLL
ncbi:MAG: HAD family phosphatase [Candidatus Staskawiczbacteria bacterium]|nr:HAD family phosphatase [Candidatus Staskawiczbacteria bacterium]